MQDTRQRVVPHDANVGLANNRRTESVGRYPLDVK
jgi:hypothetical protein